MKTLSRRATLIFQKIVDGMEAVGDSRRLDNAEGVYMALCVEVIDRKHRGLVVSLAHYYEQHGDLMADPEVCFLLSEDRSSVWPLSYKQASLGIDNEYVQFGEDGFAYDKAKQADLAGFCNTWMSNIEDQQFLDDRIEETRDRIAGLRERLEEE